MSSLKSFLLLATATAVKAGVASAVDYVIVGAGPAGYVVAEMLSRNPAITVTLLERGPDEINNTDVNIPGTLLPSANDVWAYYSQPDDNLGGLTPNLFQGSMLGGGTGVNMMGYCRGAASVFDEWAEVSGNPGLAWSSLQEDFNATTTWGEQPDLDYPQYVDTSVFGDGPIEVTRQSFLTGLEVPFAQVLQDELDLPLVCLEDGTGIGVDMSVQSITAANRTRSYARNTYGYMLETRSNVQVLPNSWVSNIGFEGTKAINVTYFDSVTNVTTVLPAGEIIVSGGAINTPKLLMQSGVGPADVLNSLDIPVVADISEIGANLWDHHYSFILVEVTNDIVDYYQTFMNSTESAIAEAQYAENYSGPLSSVSGEAFATVRLPDSLFSDIDSTFYPSLASDRPHVIYEYNGAPLLTDAEYLSRPIISGLTALVQPEASGYLTINSSDYTQAPLIHSNFYGSDSDKAAIVYAYKELRALFANSALEEFVVGEVYPGANVTSDDDIWAAVQYTARSFHHPVGTVALGTVLDSNWRIKGLENIRVVDSSALPTLTTCHPMGVVYAVAHRAAQDIVQADGIGSKRRCVH
ncbi:hypothetical protein G7054_g3113 [Neopestalotiopsis clavispora]|nr:hypothetical protein G7054_g3113 [Neopestalotiopsis clavispora]